MNGLADKLAAEFALRLVLDEDEAAGAVVCLEEKGFLIIAPPELQEAALAREALGDA